MDTAPLVSQRYTQPVNGEWPVSERARWLPALAMAIGVIYGGDEGGSHQRGDVPDLDGFPGIRRLKE